MWGGKAELIGAVNSCFGLVEREVVFAKASVEVVKGSRHKVAVFRSKCQTDIIDNSGANDLGVF
jgi:hypothetical protein